MTAPAGCAWAAVSSVPWITITQEATGLGNGHVRFAVAENDGPLRIGGLTIAGVQFTVTQASGCSYAISENSHDFNEAGGSFNITVTAGPGCTWTATESLSWVTITAGTSGVGTGTVTIVVAPLPRGADDREGNVLIAGRQFHVKQKDH